ncbi:MAG: S-layer homology domain-containing protein [Clostridiales bacterium]|nr:S-layer homology domain-containing protein [Clostridiales bacterium]
MNKRVLSMILAIVMLATLSSPAFAVSYKDINGHWAKDYMESLVSKGFLSGYNDGTMKPDKNLTACEALVILSRFYNLTDVESEMIQTDYENYVKQMVSASYSWAYKNLETCLAAGIITKDELKNISLSSEIQKEKLALFLVRALQLNSEAQKFSGSQLGFADASKISPDCLGEVALLTYLKIVNGDSSNKFLPQSSVSRAVAAAMIYRSLSYLGVNNKTLVIDAYNGVSRTEGIITSVGASSVLVCGFDGLTREFSVASDASVTVNGTEKPLGSVSAGCYVKLTWKNGVVIKLSVESNSSIKWVQGLLSSVSAATSYSSVYVKEASSSTLTGYSVSGTASVTRDGVSATLSALTANDFVTMKYVNGTVTEIRAVSGISELSGTIAKVSYGTTITMDITDSKGILYKFAFDISALPLFMRGDKTITVDSLKTSTNVTVKFDKCKVYSITAKGTGNTVTGELTSYTASSGGTVWVITSNGKSSSYTLDENVSVYSGNTAIPLSNIHIGDQLSVVVYGNIITEVYQLSSTSSSTKVEGTVLKVDTANQIITMLTPSEKLIYIKTNSLVSIIVAKTGYSTYLSSIAANSKLTAYGAYSDAKTFEAKSIIIE